MTTNGDGGDGDGVIDNVVENGDNIFALTKSSSSETITTAAPNNTNTNDNENATTFIVDTPADDGAVIVTVESLYNTDVGPPPGELIGYSCQQITQQNTVEEMDILFYMDVLSPASNSSTTTTGTATPQTRALHSIQTVLLKEMSQLYQIDPLYSQGLRCLELPVDGATWIVEMMIDSSQDFEEITLFGGCRELEWDKTLGQQECRFYEVHFRGSYIGASQTDENGTPFGDVVAKLATLVNGPKLVQSLNDRNNVELYNENEANSENPNYDISHSFFYYHTQFVGVPRVADDPNFQGGGFDEWGNDEIKEPVNIKTGIDASESAANPAGDRKTITVVGGLLIGCFTIAFVLIGYLLFQRRPKRRGGMSSFFNKKGNNNNRENTDLAGLADIGSGSADSSSPEEEDNGEEFEGTNAFARHFNLDQGEDNHNNSPSRSSNNNNNDQPDEEGEQHHHGCDDEVLHDDEPPTTPKKKKGIGLKKNSPNDRMQQQQQNPSYFSPASKGEEQEQEYADLPISNEAIRMDLGNSMKGQLMGLHGSITTNGPYGRKKSIGGSFDQRGIIDPGQSEAVQYHHQPNHNNSPGGGNGGSFNNSVDGNDSDVDSWAQTEGTIGSLELQLDPITAEV